MIISLYVSFNHFINRVLNLFCQEQGNRQRQKNDDDEIPRRRNVKKPDQEEVNQIDVKSALSEADEQRHAEKPRYKPFLIDHNDKHKERAQKCYRQRLLPSDVIGDIRPADPRQETGAA